MAYEKKNPKYIVGDTLVSRVPDKHGKVHTATVKRMDTSDHYVYLVETSDGSTKWWPQSEFENSYRRAGETPQEYDVPADAVKN